MPKSAPDDICAAAWLCTEVNGGQLQCKDMVNAPKGAFKSLKPALPDNDQRGGDAQQRADDI